MKGKIGVESVEGEGSVFTVDLPLAVVETKGAADQRCDGAGGDG